ncbi:NADPH-dependent alcohol dehydrogenase [Coprinopsis cinerea okayama7|uniref:NADPH-dependent alcohol dehydrogenase n=1 Tax=Coprinopsis cinerea (strain Okayama-7 / 130 / ATCC MYA-4618 / FGSC 9003) TaxID=240176 RepID=A8NKI5_COPC7|nr:NADPH-dependent alcohol dehydrogenase [Coprinopsis cinerea okayama7\|eukprot:XP_001834460.2 NADPH-dependent alcohol dehydrogenase [Coprinopsis cinerea okayama7\
MTKPTSDLKFKGYATGRKPCSIKDTSKWDQFEVIDFKPKTPGDRDVDIKIDYCGVCGSDLHTITAGWGDAILPIIPGHEIVGHVVSVGPKVTEFKVGDRVGVGAQISSCFQCDRCENSNENYCLKPVDTYNSKYPNGDIAQGGYSTAIRADERFVMPIPQGLASEIAAPMLCAGLTVYSPLKRNGAGHFALQFARALGSSEVIAFSHSENKKEDALQLGATQFVITQDDNFSEPWAGKIDLIICTVDASSALPLVKYLSTLKVGGRFIMVGIPDEPLPPLKAFDLVPGGCFLGGSKIGSKQESIEMLNLAAKKGVTSRIQMLPMCKAGEAVRNLKSGKVRYRHVLKVDI